MSLRTNRIALCALAAASLFALTAPADAKFIGSSFDPPTFSGSGTFLLPDTPGCLGLPDGFNSVNGGSDACTGFLLLNAAVSVSDDAGTAHLSLPPPTPSATAVTGVVVDGESASFIVGVNTTFIMLGVDDCTGDLCDYEWWIAWDSGLPSGDAALSAITSNSVTLFRQFCPDGCEGDREQFGDPATNVTFFPAPEPGSLALLVGALGAGWIVRRRRSNA